MTAPHRPPADLTDHDERRRPLLDLSLTQLLGGALAAATGAALASRLGVAGTILGAAAISLVSAIGGAAYTQSLRRTHERVRSAAERTRYARSRGGIDSPRDGVTEAPAAPPGDDPDRSVDKRVPAGPRTRPLRVRGVLAAAAAVFVVAFTAITGYELLTGEPISGAAGRTTLTTTLTGGDGSDATGTPEQPAPTSAVPTTTTTPTSTTAPTSPPASSTVPTSSSPTGSSSPPSSGPPTSAPPEPTDPPASPSPPAPSP